MSTIYCLADNIRSLYNVGALFRLCDGAGVSKLFLTGITGAPFDDLKHTRQRKQIAKTALEGLNSVTWEYRQDAAQLIAQLKSEGIQIVSLEQTPNSIDYRQAKFNGPVCLVLGHETDGVAEQILAMSDQIIELPMYGQGKSLNVISSASIALYHIKHSQAGGE